MRGGSRRPRRCSPHPRPAPPRSAPRPHPGEQPQQRVRLPEEGLQVEGAAGFPRSEGAPVHGGARGVVLRGGLGGAVPCRAEPGSAAPGSTAAAEASRALPPRGRAARERALPPPPPSCLAAARTALRRRAYIAAPTSPHRRSSPRGPALPAVMRCLPVSVRVWDSFGGVPNRQPPLRGVGRGLGSWGASGRRHSCQ